MGTVRVNTWMVGVLYIFLAHPTSESSSLNTHLLLSYIATIVYTVSAIIVYTPFSTIVYPPFDPFLYTLLNSLPIPNMPSFGYTSPRATSSIPAGNWRTSRPTSRPLPVILPGDIMFIKNCGDSDSQRYIEESRIGGGIDHPALVLGPSTLGEDRVMICIVRTPLTLSFYSLKTNCQSQLTSFAGREYKEACKGFKRQPEKLPLAIFPSPPTYDGEPQLKVLGSLLRKNSYVRLSDVYTIHTSVLEAYSGARSTSPCRLCPKSLDLVLASTSEARDQHVDTESRRRATNARTWIRQTLAGPCVPSPSRVTYHAPQVSARVSTC